MVYEAEDMFLTMDSVEDRFLLVRVSKSMVWVELRLLGLFLTWSKVELFSVIVAWSEVELLSVIVAWSEVEGLVEDIVLES